ncbi:MAG TPA: peptide-methionine (S)-S-oxide reductase MsrA [Myxococcota bacterium]|nr:peptide-methionine (S)-S-oxide reductase MsrA [Myxococcota bacterium]
MGFASLAPTAARAATETAIFAGGCFWCMVPPFEELPGVITVTSGYTGGTKPNPTYEEVSAGGTGHAESVEVLYDPAKVGYERLLDVYWHNIDPTVSDRQFCDVGNQYRSAIFVKDGAQRKAAESSRDAVQKKLGVPVKTQIVDAGPFYAAEDYHQDYYKKNPIRYRYYRWGCGRDARLEEIWGAEAPSPH